MPAVGEIIQYTFVQTMAGQRCENVWHLREVAPGTTDAQRRAAAEEMLALQQHIQTNDVLYSNVIIKQMTPLPFDEDLYVPVTTVQGAVGGPTVNQTVSAILTKRTGIAGKSHRGRVYYSGIPLGFATGNENLLSVDGTTAMGNLAAGIIGLFGESGTEPNFRVGVYSRVIGGVDPFTAAGWQELTRLDVQFVLGNQRRRRVGVGI